MPVPHMLKRKGLLVFIALLLSYSIHLLLIVLKGTPTPDIATLREALPEATSFVIPSSSGDVWRGVVSVDGKEVTVGHILLARNSQVTSEPDASGLLVGMDIYRRITHTLVLGHDGKPVDDNRDLLGQVLPGCDSYHMDEQYPLQISGMAMGSDGQPVLHGYVFLSREVAPKVNGYAGPISLLVGMDLDGKVRGVAVIAHQETPGYAEGIEDQRYLQQYINKGITDSFTVGTDLDGIARATISSQALANTVKLSLQNKTAQLLSGESAGQSNPTPIGWKNILTIAWVIISFIMLLFALRHNAPAWIRRVVQFGSVLVLGVLTLSYITAFHFGSFLMMQPPPFVAAIGLYFVLAFTLITSIFWGRAYCGFMCPLGALLDLANALSPRRLSPVSRVDGVLKHVKKLLLLGACCMALLIWSVSPLQYEPFDTVFHLDGNFIALLLAILVLLAAVPFGRIYCRYVCGVGATLGILSSHAFHKLSLAKDCDGCGTCRDICPVGAIIIEQRGAYVQADECIRCGDCSRACPRRHDNKRTVWGLRS